MTDLAGKGQRVPGLDIDVGAPGASRGAVRDAFAERGVSLCDTTLSKLRSGAITATRTSYRLACADRLSRNDASLRARFCRDVAQIGLKLRHYDRDTG